MYRLQDGPLLKTTRAVLYTILGLIAFAGALLALVSVALPIWWSEVIAQFAVSYPNATVADLLPRVLVMLAGCIIILALIWTVLRKLLAIVRTVGDGDPFVRANAVRLCAIGWLLVAIEIGGIPLAFIAGSVADRLEDNEVGYDPSFSSLLAILLAFVLARVFERGAAMREEMEGTV